MSNAQLLLAVVLAQQCLFGVMWLVSASAGLAPRAAAYWAACAWMAAGGILLIMLRGQSPAWLTVALANALVFGSFIALRRGVRHFVQQPFNDRVLLWMAACVVATVPAAALWPSLLPPAVVLAVGGIVWTLLATSNDIRRHLSAEFGRAAALWCASPLLMLSVVFIGRIVYGLAAGRFDAYASQPAGNNLPALAVAVLFSLLLHLGLLGMVLLRLVLRLRHRSDHDMLTGLLSRRPMEQLLQAEVQRQRRFGGSFALLSADIDHFKTVNDRFGHAAGDAVLERVAHALQAAAREIDSVARMGGEEFCVLLPGADADGADGVAQRMLHAVRNLQHAETQTPGGPVQVTLSIGLAVVQVPGEPVHALQRRLDQALYAAKAGGRNRIEHASPPV